MHKYVVTIWTKNMKKVYLLNFKRLEIATWVMKMKFWDYAKITDLDTQLTIKFIDRRDKS